MFEVRATDLAARRGLLTTRTGRIATPALLPVVHPFRQQVPLTELAELGFGAVMTNAYTVWRRFRNRSPPPIHRLLAFDGSVMTDSGGYQVLEYGAVEVDPVTMVRFEERLQPDIAVVLDRPTGAQASRRQASASVRQTLAAAKQTVTERARPDIQWMGPVQGGRYLDLVEGCADRLAQLPFDLYALGSPVEFLEAYDFPVVAQMILAAKRRLPLARPLHLFGAGHPLTLPLAVALGCDLFDSASYLLYARDGRYMAPWGTEQVSALTVLPCSCRVCSRHTANELARLPAAERIGQLARHNLAVLATELRTISHAIESGRMWELLGTKARAHPRLWSVFRMLRQHLDYLEDGTPAVKPKALFLFGPEDLVRPEVARHHARLRGLSEDGHADTLVLMPHSPERALQLGERLRTVVTPKSANYCWLSATFGIIPLELADLYPLAQHLSSESDRPWTQPETIRSVVEYVAAHKFQRVIGLDVEDEPFSPFDALARRINLSRVRDARTLRGGLRRVARLLRQRPSLR